jgi:oligoribonuclease
MKQTLQRLFWLDMEMTGLDVSKEVVIEVAAVITDLNFETLYEYHAVVRQPQHYLDQMDEWNTKHHGASGLTAQVPNGRAPAEVEEDLLRICDIYFASERPVLAGNSIGQDRLFIDAQFKRFAARLHYRMLDVTSWKILMADKYKIVHKKQNSHRAVDDIHESISELKTYLQYIRV